MDPDMRYFPRSLTGLFGHVMHQLNGATSVPSLPLS